MGKKSSHFDVCIFFQMGWFKKNTKQISFFITQRESMDPGYLDPNINIAYHKNGQPLGALGVRSMKNFGPKRLFSGFVGDENSYPVI